MRLCSYRYGGVIDSARLCSNLYRVVVDSTLLGYAVICTGVWLILFQSGQGYG